MTWCWRVLHALRCWLHAPIDPKIAELIKPPRTLHRGHDESLRKRTEAKREAADKMRARAALVDSGSAVREILRMVGR